MLQSFHLHHTVYMVALWTTCIQPYLHYFYTKKKAFSSLTHSSNTLCIFYGYIRIIKIKKTPRNIVCLMCINLCLRKIRKVSHVLHKWLYVVIHSSPVSLFLFLSRLHPSIPNQNEINLNKPKCVRLFGCLSVSVCCVCVWVSKWVSAFT